MKRLSYEKIGENIKNMEPEDVYGVIPEEMWSKKNFNPSSQS